MTGINKRSNQPVPHLQQKMKVNPLYNTFGLIKAVGDKFKTADQPEKKKK